MNKTLEDIAFSNAPNDKPDDPAYPNFSDTDIYVNGFKDGFMFLYNKLIEDGQRENIMYLIRKLKIKIK